LTGAWLRERAHRDGDGAMVLAIDGKVLRGSWTGERNSFTLFSAMIHGWGVTVAQVKVPVGTNEITQSPKLPVLTSRTCSRLRVFAGRYSLLLVSG
jgi:hypothetical protein